MEKYPSLSTAKVDVALERIEKQMCQVYHTEMLKKFSRDTQSDEMVLPSVLNHLKDQKSHIFQMADSMGINISAAKDNENMVLTKESDPVGNKYNYLELSPSSISLLVEDLKKVHLDTSSSYENPKTGHSMEMKNNRSRDSMQTPINSTNRCAGRLNMLDTAPKVMTFFGENADYVRHRRSLPIYPYRKEILDQIEKQQVVIIAGDVGCGKTTQVPQYILEDANHKKTPCRIVSVQPRRISALAAAERVTLERGYSGEEVVGHHIRLESKCKEGCPLIFCTTSVFLRTLMDGDRCLKGLTHVIIDQVNDRDRFTDLLLGVFRLRLSQHPKLRLILLTANMSPHTVAHYFHQENIIRIPVASHPVSAFFLEDVLTCTKFLSKQSLLLGAGTVSSAFSAELTPLGPATYFDELIADAWFKGSEVIFVQLMKLVREGTMSIDYQHSQTGITILMAAAIHGSLDVVKAAIAAGANPTFQLKGMTPYDLANEFARPEIADVLYSYGQVFCSELGPSINFAEPPMVAMNQNSPDDVLKSFYAKYSQDHANLDLIMEVLSFVQGYSQAGAILVFLPAYSEVVELRDMIATSSSSLKNKLEVHTLHGHLPIAEFRKLFLPASPDKRKVILSTNIAETSISFEDVACVIDSGLMRDRETDVVFTNPGKTRWISKTSAMQRIMHVRKGGLIFHLYPRSRLEGFQEFPVPEITRDPLVDVCLHARMVIPDDMRLPQFFCSLPDSPPTTTVHQAMEVLQAIDALDSQSRVTEVGRRLADLPVDPRLGKMILVATGLKCLDPVLSIVSCLSRDDPFITPPSPDERKVALARKFELAAHSLSDHLALLAAYQLWERANDEGHKRQVCQENFLSVANLEMIFLLRVQLVGELRASGYIKARGSCEIKQLNIHSESWAAIKAALTAGLYPNVARYSPVDGSITTYHETRSQFHFNSTLLVQEGRNNGLSGTGLPSTGNSSSKYPNSFAPRAPLKTGMPTSPWIVFEDHQRAGQFTILRCCTAITPINALLFAGHWASPIQILQLSEKDHQEAVQRWDEDDYDSDDMDEEEMLKFCHDLNLAHKGRDVVGLSRVIRSNKKLSKQRKNFVIIRIDEFVGFIVDSYTAQLIMAVRQKFQSMLLKGIREPGRTATTAEDSVLRTVLSILSSEEMGMQLVQPTGIGRRPSNVSADSMLVVPQLNTGELYQVKQYTVYTPPPKGCVYETKESSDGINSNTAGVFTGLRSQTAHQPQQQQPYGSMKTAGGRDWSFTMDTSFNNLSFQEAPSQYYHPATQPIPLTGSSNVPPTNGRPIFKSYNQRYSPNNN